MAARVGRRIRELREEADISFDAFVEELGAGRGYLSELERGLVVPSLTILMRVAKILDVSIGDIVLIGDSAREQVFRATRTMPDAVVRRLARDVAPLAKRTKG